MVARYPYLGILMKNRSFRSVLALCILLTVVVLSCKNSPPRCPEPPAGVSIGGPNIPYQFTATATDPEADSIAIRFSWGDGDTSAWSGFVPSGEAVTMSHTWSASGYYQVKAQAQDRQGRLTAWSRPSYLTIGEGILKWRYPETGFVLSSPASSPAVGPGGTIYIAEASIPRSHLLAINPDGTLKWCCQIDDFLGYAAPAIGADGTVYITGYNDGVYAVTPDGILKWKYEVEVGTIYSPPAIGADGTVYVASEDGCIYALNSEGAFKWRCQTGDAMLGPPAVGSDGTVYIDSDDWSHQAWYIYALNPDGTLKWRYETEG